jgi:hypothetical protein
MPGCETQKGQKGQKGRKREKAKRDCWWWCWCTSLLTAHSPAHNSQQTTFKVQTQSTFSQAKRSRITKQTTTTPPPCFRSINLNQSSISRSPTATPPHIVLQATTTIRSIVAALCSNDYSSEYSCGSPGACSVADLFADAYVCSYPVTRALVSKTYPNKALHTSLTC